MAPNLRKRVWYQRYLGTDNDDVTSYGVLFRKSSTDRFRRPHVNHGGSSGGKYSGSRRTWKRPAARRCGSHDSESGSYSLSDDEIPGGEIKMEVVEDTKDFPRKNTTVPLPNAVTAKCQGRMLMREWLEANANGGCMSGLKWLDKDLGLVQIAWKHGSRAGWNRSDVEVFESWALHTGKFNPKKSDCKRWKANFRCALNSLPDVIEIKEKCNTRSRNPYKVYRLLPPHKVSKQKKLLTSSDGYVLPQQLSQAYSSESDVLIKEEPVDQEEEDDEESDFTNLETLQHTESANGDDTPPGECKDNEEIVVQNAVKTSIQRNQLNEPFAFKTTIIHVPDVHQNEGTTTTPQQPLTTANSIRHNDHSYANSFEHLNEEQKTEEEQPDLADGHDLMSTINEELAKFCSSNFGVDFWNEETEICATKFILQDVMDSSDLDGFLLQ